MWSGNNVKCEHERQKSEGYEPVGEYRIGKGAAEKLRESEKLPKSSLKTIIQILCLSKFGRNYLKQQTFKTLRQKCSAAFFVIYANLYSLVFLGNTNSHRTCCINMTCSKNQAKN